MRFELFDRAAIVAGQAPDGPMVRVNVEGRLLLNRQAWLFMYQPLVTRFEVSLLFDAETRQAGIRPEAEHLAGVADSTRWPVRPTRSTVWPQRIDAREFVTHYRIAVGSYAAQFVRGPGPRMMVLQVGQGRDLPAGRPRGVIREDEPLADGVDGR